MADIRNGNTSANVAVKIPPGAYIMRFYQQGALAATTSGVDCHPTGGRLIKIIAKLKVVNTADVVLGIQKNGVEAFQLTIPANQGYEVYDVQAIEGEASMDFTAVVDDLQVEVITPSGEELTVLAVFNR